MADQSQADVVPDNSPILDVLERFADLVDEVRETAKSRPLGAFDWEGAADDVIVCHWGRLICKWRHAGRTDRPPHTLIVRLLKELPDVLREVCNSPKRVLRRQREIEPISRLRELDPTCIRWVTRQPGISLIEKAGHRQSLLAVKRYESANTLENRVVLSLIRRCRRLCREYLRLYAIDFANHQRVIAVSRFERLCRQLLLDPFFSEVASLDAVPKPNYVLLHDDRYRKIWHAFLLVSRQQRRKQLLWSNRRSLFGDILVFGMQNAMSSAVSDREFRKYSHRFDVGLRASAVGGSFFDSRFSPPVWRFGDVHAYFGSACHSPIAIDDGDTDALGSKLAFVIQSHDDASSFSPIVATFDRTVSLLTGDEADIGRVEFDDTRRLIGRLSTDHIEFPINLFTHPKTLAQFVHTAVQNESSQN